MRQAAPQELVERALEASTSPECVAILTVQHSANLRWANNTLTTNGVLHWGELTVIAFRDGGNASVSGPAVTAAQVEALVAQADAEARTAGPAEDRAPLVTGDATPDFDLAPAQTSIGVFDAFARQLGEEFDRAEAESRILYGFVDHGVETTYVGTSTGLRLRHAQPTGHYACTGKDAALTHSAWVGGATRDFRDVDAADMVQRLTTRMGWGRERSTLPAGRYDTIMSPSTVADLMIEAYWDAGARTAYEGMSAYARRGGGTRIGEQVVQPGVRLRSDPAHPGLECAPFAVAGASGHVSSVYDNGLPLGATDWIRDGRLEALLQTRHTAQMTGQPVTPAVDNLVLEVDGATASEEDLVAGMDDGLLLTCLWYIRSVDPQTMLVTGLTRDGVYRVQGGEITGAVNNFRFNESPLDLLRRFSHASLTGPAFSREWGDEFFSRTAMPALRVPDFNMSSVSQAL